MNDIGLIKFEKIYSLLSLKHEKYFLSNEQINNVLVSRTNIHICY
jgi:hypothetical protein